MPLVQAPEWVVVSIFLSCVKGPVHLEAGQVDLIHWQALFAWARDGNTYFHFLEGSTF